MFIESLAKTSWNNRMYLQLFFFNFFNFSPNNISSSLKQRLQSYQNKYTSYNFKHHMVYY